MTASLLEIDNLRTWLQTAEGVVRAVDGLSLTIPQGETFALLGESGCGKSITALSIMRLLPEAGRIMEGRIRLRGNDLLHLSEMEMRNVRGKRISMIFQEPMLSLNPVMTIGSQVAEVLGRHLGIRGEGADRRIVELLEAVGLPDAHSRRGQYPFQLSGGQKQRVMIAMALACEPDLLIADEPTTALDVTIQAQVLDLLRELQARRKMAMLLITHDLGVVAEMAHQVAVMYAGELVERADRQAFFEHPVHPYSQKLFASLPTGSKRGQALAMIKGAVPALTGEFMGCRFADRCEMAWEHCFQTLPRWHELTAGHWVRCHLYEKPLRPKEDEGLEQPGCRPETVVSLDRYCPDSQAEVPPDDPPILSVKGLKVYFPVRKGLLQRIVAQVKAVDGLSLTIPVGRTLALVGESGCGKTTVGKGILGLLEVTEGSVRVADRELTVLTPTELRPLRREFQIIFQDPYASLNPRMRIAEILEEGMSAQGIGHGHGDRMGRIERLLTEVGLSPDILYRYPHEFSGGQRQRLAIARALAVEPKLIICDEPTSALDVSVQAQILNLLKELQMRHGLSYLFITHNISVVEFLAHEVAVMYLGRIVERGMVEEMLAEPRHPYTRALWSAVPRIEAETRREVIRLQGDLPSPQNPPQGCHFHPRCPKVMPICRDSFPGKTLFSPTHSGQCHLYPFSP
jgi:peptide/nickel transport system ATP-binding protein